VSGVQGGDPVPLGAGVQAGVEADEAGQSQQFGGGAVQPSSDRVGVAAFVEQAGDVAQVLVDQGEQLPAAELVVHPAKPGGDLVKVVDDLHRHLRPRQTGGITALVGDEPFVGG
jgi:hypothetical protein